MDVVSEESVLESFDNWGDLDIKNWLLSPTYGGGGDGWVWAESSSTIVFKLIDGYTLDLKKKKKIFSIFYHNTAKVYTT